MLIEAAWDFYLFLIEVVTLRGCRVATLLRIYVNEGKIRIEQHLFEPKSKNTIINGETKCLFCRVEGGDAHWTLYRRPVVTGVAETQEGGGITRTWIEDPMVYPGTPMPQWCRWVPERTAVATAAVFVKIVRCLLIILAALCCLCFCAILTQRQDLVSFPQRRHHRKSKKSSYIYMKMPRYCNYTILMLTTRGRHNVDWPSARFYLFPVRRCYVFTLQRCDVSQNFYQPR